MYRLVPRVVHAFVLIAALLPAAAGFAHADPVPVVGALADSPTLSLADLGSYPDIALYGQQGTQLLTFPVPAGMTPVSLNVTAELPVYVGVGTLTVVQDNREISRVDLPTTGRTPVVVPLDGVQVFGNAVTVLLRGYLLPIEGYCLDPTNPLRLTGISVTFAGAELPPRTVADFLPPVLRKLTIYVGANPSQTESDAVVKLADAIVAQYGKQYPAVEVAQLGNDAVPAPGMSGPFERHIVVSEGPDTGVSLVGTAGPSPEAPAGVPALLIAGPAGALANQVRLLTSNVARLALASKAVAGPLSTVAVLPGNTTTIRELGQPGVNATALQPQVGITLDQTRMGRSVRGVRVHLIGSYTPLPSVVAGQLVAAIGGETLATWPAQADGTVDRWIDVPDRLLQRATTLNLAVNMSGDTGKCGEFQPITLTIDGATVVESALAEPPVPVGFQSMPQSMMPRVQIGIGSSAFADTVRAVAIVAGLQRMSTLPFDTVVMPLQQALDSPNPGILIAADGWNQPDIDLPVSAPSEGTTTIDTVDGAGKPTTLTLEPQLGFGSLQVAFDGGRSLLVATSNGAAGQLDTLLRWLDADLDRWTALNGVAVVAAPGHDPVIVSGPDSASESTPSDGSRPEMKVWAVAALVALVAVGATVAFVRSRRRGSDG